MGFSTEKTNTTKTQQQGKNSTDLNNLIRSAKGGNVDSCLILGKYFYEQKEYQNSICYYELALKYRPKDTEILYNLAFSYAETPQYDKVREIIHIIGYKDSAKYAALYKLWLNKVSEETNRLVGSYKKINIDE